MDVLRTLELGNRSAASRRVISKVCRTRVVEFTDYMILIDRSGRVLIMQLLLVRVDEQVWHLLQEQMIT